MFTFICYTRSVVVAFVASTLILKKKRKKKGTEGMNRMDTRRDVSV